MAVPMRRQPWVRIGRPGSNRPKWRPMTQERRRQGQCRHQRDKDAGCSGNAQALKIREPGERQAEHRAGNRQARAQDDVRGPSVHRFEGRYPILPGVARFVEAAQNEDRIIRSGRDDQQRQQIGRVGRQLDDSGVRQHGDDSARRGQLDHHRENHENHRGETAVERKQHHRDHTDGDQRGLQGAFAAHLELIGDQGRGAGDIGLDPRRRRRLVDDVAYRVDGLIGQRLALVAGEIHLHQCRLAVGALRAGRRQRIPPEILNVLDVLGVPGELVDQAVVVVVGVGTERLVALQDDHRRTVGVELVKHLADALAGLQRRRILGAQRHVVCFGNVLQLRHENIRDHGQAQPEQRDQHRKPPDRVRDRTVCERGVLIRTCPDSR